MDIKKLVKKERYEMFVLGKEFKEIVYLPQAHYVRLPLRFVSQGETSMDEVQVGEDLFFHYMANYCKF